VKNKQTGIALITAMLVVALAAILATQIFYQQQINLRRTSNQLQADKIYLSLVNIETFVKVMLSEDLKDNAYDSKQQLEQANEMLLGASLDYSASEVGQFGAEIKDAQACFNLNNLFISGAVQNKQVDILRRSLQQQGIDEFLINNLIWSLVDWLDPDDEPKEFGAEWETYSQLTPPYQTANQALTEINELYAVQYWNQINIDELTDICVLPTVPEFTQEGRFVGQQTQSRININTASERLLRSLSDKMFTANIDAVLQIQTEEAAFESAQAFLDQLDKDNPQSPKLSTTLDATLLSTSSQFFMLEYAGKINHLEQQYKSLLYRRSEQEIDTLYHTPFY